MGREVEPNGVPQAMSREIAIFIQGLGLSTLNIQPQLHEPGEPQLRLADTGKERHSRVMIIPGFVHVAVLTFSLAGVALSGAETPARLGSMVVDWGARPVKPTDVGQRRDICEAPTPTLVRLESHVSTLNPGKTSHPPHRHPQEEVIFLREGSLEVSINGQVHHAGPGSILFFASNDLHNVTNSGIVPATYVVFQFSTPATASAPAADGTRDAHWLKSQVFDWSTTAVKATKPGERRDFFDSPTATFRHLECHATTLRPGEIPHPPHRHADEEIIVMKEGNVTVELNGVPHEAGPQSVALFASNDLHGMKNTGTTNATYYVLRVGP